MLLGYGHAQIEWSGNIYNVAPTFANIAKIGTPSDIIDDFKSFITSISPIHKFNIALNVLRSCCDKELPESFTGRVELRNGVFKYVQPQHGVNVFNDVIHLGEHCLIHGICGKVKYDDESNGESLKEFDAYKFIEMASIYLDCSSEDAANMTMTQFIRLMNVKHPKPIDETKASKSEEKDMVEWFNKNNEVH